jgi:hypothetical protein
MEIFELRYFSAVAHFMKTAAERRSSLTLVLAMFVLSCVMMNLTTSALGLNVTSSSK